MENQSRQQARQLIDSQKHYSNQSFQKIIEGLANVGKDYYSVAIIGAQNTGKSTLLNHLFGTSFAVLKGEAGNRTTRGIVLSRDKSSNLLIMDVQGNDSYQTHLSGDENYERMVSSFALIGAHILLVNIFEKQLGQHAGSQYETLSTIMRICIDQFKQQSPKTILFCLRDANPNYTDIGQCRRKVQQDVMKIWKDVFAGSKKSEQFEKYNANHQRFFSLQICFLRQYDIDYPQDFIQDIKKLRQRFIDPECQDYLFKRQNKQYNLPIKDLQPLYLQIWQKLITNKQLNLPNQKIQLANYRCQQLSTQLRQKYEKDIEVNKDKVRNYEDVLSQMSKQFKQNLSYYPKNIVQKWQAQLVQKFHPKIRKIIMGLLQNKQKQLQEQFNHNISNLFIDQSNPHDHFRILAQKQELKLIQQLINVYKEIAYEVSNRKERIDAFTGLLQTHIDNEVNNKIENLKMEFQNDVQSSMKYVVLTTMKSYFNLQFYTQLTRLYMIKKSDLMNNYDVRVRWTRGKGATVNQLDDIELKMIQWLKKAVKKQFQQNLVQKLLQYFQRYFHYDDNMVRYDYNLLNDEKSIQIYKESKEMTMDLLKKLNNFRLQAQRRSSFIFVQNDQEEEKLKVLFQPMEILNIQQNFERKVGDQYSNVQRKRSQSKNRKIPKLLIFLIFFFIYDDLYFTAEQNPFLHYLLIVILIAIGFFYAIGQDVIVRQFGNIFYQKSKKVVEKSKLKFKQIRRSNSDPASQDNQSTKKNSSEATNEKTYHPI